MTPLAVPSRVALSSTSQAQVSGGWWGAEAEGRWIGAQDAGILVNVAAGAKPVGLRIFATPFDAVSQQVEVTAAGKVLFNGAFSAEAPISFVLPPELVGTDVTLVLHFPTVDPHCPSSLGLATDERTLIAFVSAVETFAPAVGG